MNTSLSQPQKKKERFKVKVEEMNAAETCKCRQRRACWSCRVSGVPLRYCTTLCHRSTALAAPLLVAGSMCAEAEEEEKSGHLVRAAGAGGWRLRGGHCPQRAGVVCDRCCLLATEGKTCVIPSEPPHPSRGCLTQGSLPTTQTSERRAAGRLDLHFIFILKDFSPPAVYLPHYFLPLTDCVFLN